MQLFERAPRSWTSFALAAGVAAGLAVAAWAAREEPRGRVVVTETETTVLDKIEFEPGSELLRPASLPMLDAVAATLSGNPSIARVQVQAYCDEDLGGNLTLGYERAAHVVDELVARGVARERLEPADEGAPGATGERIAFVILERADAMRAEP